MLALGSAVAAVPLIKLTAQFNPLTDGGSGIDYSPAMMQMIGMAFCMSPVVPMLLEKPVDDPNGENYSFVEEGDLQEEDYKQDSIYSILYSLYKNTPTVVSEHGVKYEFTFNTWGIANSAQAAYDAKYPIHFEPYPETDPQRHGKQAYRGLVVQPPVKKYIESLNRKPQIVEIGCGTGAGANLITREVWPDSEYLALDMQQAAINTCNRKHATPDNNGLTCRRIPDGVGVNGGRVPKEDSSVDIVVISETHIAESVIGDLEKVIFAEIYRVLKPGGYFVWGNALPTRVWHQGNEYLPTAGFEMAYNTNHTQGAVVARDEDAKRVDLFLNQLLDSLVATKLPYFGERCAQASKRLIANFFRHPGTAMYLKMVSGTDSYMHQAWRVVK
jgi:ubiquinone/menaquinone biosynthesis C-methylase UbiE